MCLITSSPTLNTRRPRHGAQTQPSPFFFRKVVVIKEATPGSTHEEKAMVVRDAGLPSSLVEDSYVQQLIQQHKTRKDAMMREDNREVTSFQGCLCSHSCSMRFEINRKCL